MPPKRESLESVKTRLAREQRIRTEQRVRQLLQQSVTRQDREIYDDSEEENRISGRRPRANRDQATQTNSSSFSSPGICSEGGTGVVVAKGEGEYALSILTCPKHSNKHSHHS
jgi:hypothetical protein